MREWIDGRRLVAVAFAVACALFALFVFRPGQQASAGVALSDPTAWIEHGLEGEVLQVNGATGEVVARIDVGEPGEQLRAVEHGSGAAVLNQTTGTVSLIDSSSLSVTQTIEVELSDGPDDRGVRVFGGRDDSDTIAVVDHDRILTVDIQTDLVDTIEIASRVTSVEQRENGQIVTLSADAVVVEQLGPNGLDPLVSLPDSVGDTDDERTLVRSGGTIWLVDPARLSTTEISATGELGRPTCVKTSASGAILGGSVGTEADGVLVGYNADRDLVSVADVANRDCSEFDLELEGDQFGPPVVRSGVAYLANWAVGRIEIIDLDEERLLRSVPFGTPGHEFDLSTRGSLVWANDRQGPFAAVVSETGLLPVPKLEAIVAGAVETTEDGDGDALVGGGLDGPGLRIIGDSGDQVIAANGTQSDGVGTGSDADPSDDSSLDAFGDQPSPQPDAIGIAVQGPADGPVSGPETPAEPTTALLANFGVSPATAKVGEVVTFTDFSSGSPTSWTWDFGDGTGAQEPDVQKSWDAEGVYVVELVVRNAVGDESSLTTEVTIVPQTVLIAPTADFVFDRDTIEEGEVVSFESRTVGEVDLLEWDFGDGTVARGPAVEHSYSQVGTYTVTLVASNPAGASTNSTTITVVSGIDPPQAAIAPIPTKVVTGQFVTLQSISLNEPSQLRWDLGDGTRASGSSVRHSWSTPGTYRVRLTVENTAGTDATFTDVVVSRRVDPPVSEFTQSATSVLVGEEVSFTSLSRNEPTSLAWSFGDDTTARGATTSKSWSRPGTYRVTLRAANEAGADQSSVNITVAEPVDPPIASFTAGSLIASPGQTISFQDTSSNSPTSWSWDFGDAGVSSSQNTSHVYSDEGRYTVRLTVSNEGGSSTAERVIEVKPPPSANFRWETDGRSVKFTDTSWDDPQSWSWDFGDGTTSNRRSPSHRFEQGGSYEVTLTVSNEVGTSAPKTQTVRVGEPPVPAFSCDADDAVLTCDASASQNVVSYRWRSPGSILNTTPGQVTTNFAYDSSGRFDVTLEVASPSGETATLTERSPRVDRVRAPRVTDVKVVDEDQNLVRLEAKFDRNPTDWEWSVEGASLVEGGNTSSPVFRVPTNGQYSGTVRASNALGDDTERFDFTVDSFVTQAAFDWEIVRPGVVRFTNRSIARDDAEYGWTFRGPAEILDARDSGPTVAYSGDGGSYNVILTVSDANGDDRVSGRVEIPAE